jgi:hypothetical protein
VTVTGYAPDDLAPTRPDGSGTGIPARRTAFDDLADRAARLPWCWPALLTLAFGVYQVGRPELWRDELASWSFASRPVPDLIALVPSVSRFAQEARFYAFAVLAATLATLLLLRALDRPSAPRWLAYTASLALLGYVDVVALSVLAGHAAGAVLRYRHRRTAGCCGSCPPSRAGWRLPRPGYAERCAGSA